MSAEEEKENARRGGALKLYWTEPGGDRRFYGDCMVDER